MTINAKGQHEGDPEKFCEILELRCANWAEARRIALLHRVLSDLDMRDRLFDAADAIEQEQIAASQAAPC